MPQSLSIRLRLQRAGADVIAVLPPDWVGEQGLEEGDAVLVRAAGDPAAPSEALHALLRAAAGDAAAPRVTTHPRGEDTESQPGQSPARHQAVLEDFAHYCQAHPAERFWQALRNWSGAAFLIARESAGTERDTFFWEGRDG